MTCDKVRNGIIQHVRACVDIWEKTRLVGSSAADDLSDGVPSASSDGPGDDFFDELCARVCDLLVVICHHACTSESESTSVWYVACDDVRSARLRCKPSTERTDDVWVEPAACVSTKWHLLILLPSVPLTLYFRYARNGERVTKIRREVNVDGTEWIWVRSEDGVEGYILGTRLQQRKLQQAIFDVVAESVWFFQLVLIMAENDHAGKAHGIIVLLLSTKHSGPETSGGQLSEGPLQKILRTIVSARPSYSVVDIVSFGLESCAVAVGSCAAIKVLIQVLHFHINEGASPIEKWVIAAQRVLRCVHTSMFETDPVTDVVIHELDVSFEFLDCFLSWDAAHDVIKQQLFPSSVLPKHSNQQDISFLTVLQQLLNVIAVGGTGSGLSRVMTARVEPAAQQVACVWCSSRAITRSSNSQ